MTINTIVHHEGTAALTVAAQKVILPSSVIKLGLDMHSRLYVVVAQYDHALPRAARRFAPEEFVPWVESLLRAGHTVHVVYEACGFGFGLYRQLVAAGAHCCVIAPRQLDEQRTGVKTDPRDAATLCQRLSRFVDGNTRELAVIRVPSETEEQDFEQSTPGLLFPPVGRRRQSVIDQQAATLGLEPLAVMHQLLSLMPEWMVPHLECYRPILCELDQQIAALTRTLEAAAPAKIPGGMGKLTTVVIGREICDWQRFKNRRTISSYTGLCPGEHSSGDRRAPGSVTKHGNPRVRAALVECAWRMVRFQPQYPPVRGELSNHLTNFTTLERGACS